MFFKKPEEFSCRLYSDKYFALCAAGGALACGLTHTMVTPLDLIKCRMQIDPQLYPGLISGFRRVVYCEGGFSKLVRGWAPTLFGYGLQGAIKFSGYEYFKRRYSCMVSAEDAYEYRTYLYLAASATAEMIADVFLSPFEATKVRMQTSRCYTSRMREAVPHMLSTEGVGTFYRSLFPLWGRQVPYTMMKFSSFERTIEYLYACVVPKKREDCTKTEQLVVTFTAGYIAGVLCAVVSHPADVLVSKLSKDPSASVGGLLSELGFSGLWGGLIPRIIMVGTLTGMQWFIYDGFKVYTRMPRPPPLMPP